MYTIKSGQNAPPDRVPKSFLEEKPQLAWLAVRDNRAGTNYIVYWRGRAYFSHGQ